MVELMNEQQHIMVPEIPSPAGGQEGLKALYFIGIGGIGMSALARYFHTQGWRVSGYDKTSTVLTKELEASGISIRYEENVDAIPKDVQLVVYTPAIPELHKELVYYRQHGFKVVKRSDVLQIITESSFNICVAGTHGKTTITTMTAHLLRDTGYGCNAFLGGISVNYGTNFWSSERNVCVIEADEYDRSFLKLSPDIAVISSMDPDHLDIYGTAEAMEQAFIDFSNKVKPRGLLISKLGLKRGKELKPEKQLTYSLQDQGADIYAENIGMKNGSYEFDAVMKNNRFGNVVLNMGGMHNIENVLAAIAVAASLGIENDKIKSAVSSFRGVKRRFQYIIKNENLVFIDDYAHHPEELRALITGTKGLFSDKRCTLIFQPHLYSRTRDFADGFAEVLDLADEVILLPVYPARELPIEGVNSEMILRRMKNKNKQAMSKSELMDWIKKEYSKRNNRVLVTAGAGDIDAMVEPVKESLN
ncbi:MAG: UDP-N-acetylmuramate--L-alanine ligase [Chitinophagaceae bacterium]|nr:UDP-N-acetylmuramate--L-alanine ligase [Chitinophagaceae bacterium]